MATDHFCLIWNNFQNSILSALGNLQTCQDLVDVTLMCEGQNVKAHKVILSACSPYFRNLFKEHPCQHPIIILKDVTHSDLTALLQFMYQGEVMVSQDNLASFLKTAELLQISGLTGSQQSTSNSNADQSERTQSEKRPKAPPDTNLGKPPDIKETVSDKPSQQISFKKQKRDRDSKNDTEIINRENKSNFDTESDPMQSCSYDSSSPIIIKTESIDKDYDEMDTETGDLEEYDNDNSQLEETSILERSLKAQSGPHSTKQYMDLSISSVNLEQAKQMLSDKRKMNTIVGPPVVKRVYRNVVTSDSSKGDEVHESMTHGWNQSQEGLCPHCNKTYSNQSALKYHVRLVHSDLLHMFFCHLCPESFKYREHYKAHMWEVHNVRN